MLSRYPEENWKSTGEMHASMEQQPANCPQRTAGGALRICHIVRARWFVTLLSLACCVFHAGAQPPGRQLSFERASHLRRGINASMWFAQSQDGYQPQRLSTYITARDFKLIHRLGLDHVRLSIDPEPLLAAPLTDGLNADYLKLLDGAVKEILDNHLNVVLDIQPESGYKLALKADPAALQAFLDFWSAFAAHYAATNPERVYFEILNEPELKVADWAKIQAQAIPVIRRAAPRHTIIATSGAFSGLHDLLLSQPAPDPNVIYALHDYDPIAFTHQGAGWMIQEVQHLSRIPYPSTPENIQPKLGEEQNLANQFWLDEYGLDQWNAARIASEIAFARKWSDQYHVPVWCGEFGVFRDFADPPMRAAWLHDMRVSLEANGIGWAMWDYRATFALVTYVNGKPVADPLVVQALGLNAGHRAP